MALVNEEKEMEMEITNEGRVRACTYTAPVLDRAGARTDHKLVCFLSKSRRNCEGGGGSLLLLPLMNDFLSLMSEHCASDVGGDGSPSE